NALVELAKYLSTFIALAVGRKVFVQYGDLKLKLAQANLTNARAERLRAKGKISQKARQHKVAEEDTAQLEAMRSALSPQQPPVVTLLPIKKADAAIRAELKAINRLDVLPIVRELARARRAVMRGSQKPEHMAALEDANQRLHAALWPMSDVD